tara:strand:- start:34 stop:348 length:315 start_codon:yes stop_codon:yes gene_type:complete
MGLGSLAKIIGKGIGLATKHSGKISKALGSINNASKSFGQLSQSGRAFGSLANNISGGRLAQSSFGKNVENMLDKVDSANMKIGSMARDGQSQVSEAVERLNRY